MTSRSSMSLVDECENSVLNAVKGMIGELKDDIRVTINTIKMELGDMNTKLNITYQIVTNQPVNLNSVGYERVRVPKPQAYRVARDAKELDKFILTWSDNSIKIELLMPF